MDKPSVSIIVPVYNVEPYVEDCIRSVMRQTYNDPMECIVVDDCGTDNGMAVVERLIADYKGPIQFKVLHHDHNRGLSAARNTGMEVATGDYLFFLDSDDKLTDDCIERLSEPLEKEQYDVVMGNVQCYKILPCGELQRESDYLELHISEDLEQTPSLVIQAICEWQNMTAWNRLYKTEFIRRYQLKFKEGLLYEDQLWSFQIACLASSFYVSHHITYYYKLREGSISYPHDKQKYIENLITIVKEMNRFVDEYHINMFDIYQIFRMFFNRILSFYSTSNSRYISIYKETRPYVKAPIRYIIHVNGFHFNAYFHDMHYLLPTFIAPYWQIFIYRKICSIISHIKSR